MSLQDVYNRISFTAPKAAMVALVCAVASSAFADNPDGPSDPVLYVYSKMFNDRRNFDCFMDFFQERKLPDGPLCRSFTRNLEWAMREAGLPVTEPAIKALERDVFWRVREDLGRAFGKIK